LRTDSDEASPERLARSSTKVAFTIFAESRLHGIVGERLRSIAKFFPIVGFH
jgi:hypothetical protein